MVRNLPLFTGSGRGCESLDSSIELISICIDDFTIESLSESEREARFARSRWTTDVERDYHKSAAIVFVSVGNGESVRSLTRYYFLMSLDNRGAEK